MGHHPSFYQKPTLCNFSLFYNVRFNICENTANVRLFLLARKLIFWTLYFWTPVTRVTLSKDDLRKNYQLEIMLFLLSIFVYALCVNYCVLKTKFNIRSKRLIPSRPKKFELTYLREQTICITTTNEQCQFLRLIFSTFGKVLQINKSTMKLLICKSYY